MSKAEPRTLEFTRAVAESIAECMSDVEVNGTVITTTDITDGRVYTITVHPSFKHTESDDDGDDDEQPADGESFDGGFGSGSYFARAMAKDD